MAKKKPFRPYRGKRVEVDLAKIDGPKTKLEREADRLLRDAKKR